ncbi:hypothetical protein LWI28_008614 [Acer negundo]|uniref:2Fe-2S ferredoxin-type domain-containing protein n=1 Tax=Acer negundo TaxID=4023 RepID=A0AAD5JGA7_ACENE|nr:hypothetical protein LWI28_008614 [Acer negundo]
MTTDFSSIKISHLPPFDDAKSSSPTRFKPRFVYSRRPRSITTSSGPLASPPPLNPDQALALRRSNRISRPPNWDVKGDNQAMQMQTRILIQHLYGQLMDEGAKCARLLTSSSLATADNEVDPDETILSKALDSGLTVPHDCKPGVCITCPAKLLGGSVDQSEGMLSDDVVERGFALLCAAYPHSDCHIKTIPEEELLSMQLATADD